MIAVIDYGMGNLESVSKAIKMIGFDVCVTSDKNDLYDASGVILPGVGAFPDCMNNLNALDLVEPIKEVIAHKPFLGICLGLQLLFDESDEFGPSKGLGVFPGKVKRFADGMVENGEKLKIPHMGWNSISKKVPSSCLDGIDEGSYFYFVHSYYVETDAALVATSTDYGIRFTSSIAHGNIFACQFHPEKSQKLGLQLLQNFCNLTERKV